MWSPFPGDPTGILGFACFHNVWDPTNPDSVAAQCNKEKQISKIAEDICHVLIDENNDEEEYDYNYDSYYDEDIEEDEYYDDDDNNEDNDEYYDY